MSKTIAKLIERAERTGSANLNGRKHDYNYIGPIEEKYHIELHNNILEFRHWGSTTLLANIETKEVIQFYGIGISDQDSLNFIANHFNLPYIFRYLPSKDEFYMFNKETKQIIII